MLDNESDCVVIFATNTDGSPPEQSHPLVRFGPMLMQHYSGACEKLGSMDVVAVIRVHDDHTRVDFLPREAVLAISNGPQYLLVQESLQEPAWRAHPPTGENDSFWCVALYQKEEQWRICVGRMYAKAFDLAEGQDAPN